MLVWSASPALGSGKASPEWGNSMQRAVGHGFEALLWQASGFEESSFEWDERIGRRLP